MQSLVHIVHFVLALTLTHRIRKALHNVPRMVVHFDT
jgi:hypothetical protein